MILWQHRWKRAIAAGLLFTVINLAWLSAMLDEAGGWDRYRAASAEYAYQCGYLNSIWHLGFIDGPVRYAVKLGMALVWTLGPALLVVPRGAGAARAARARLVSRLADGAGRPACAGLAPAGPIRSRRLELSLRSGPARAGGARRRPGVADRRVPAGRVVSIGVDSDARASPRPRGCS